MSEAILRDITPIMTSNSTPSGYVASASSVHEDRDAYKAFDNVLDTGTSQTNYWHSTVGLPQWISLQFPEAIKVHSFSITNRGSVDSFNTYGITAFRLEGSNNGSSFVTLGEYTRDGDLGLTTTHVVTNMGLYKYYRVYITDSAYIYSNQKYAVIDQIRFYEEGIEPVTKKCILNSSTLTNIADAIRTQKGISLSDENKNENENYLIPTTSMANEILSIETGIDTSDATATASDMANGVTAYVNGEKVTGKVPVCDSTSALIWSNANVGLNTEGNIRLSRAINDSNDIFGNLIRYNATLTLNTPISNFGDATAADVLSGKTFTSSAGLKVAGTLTTQTKTVNAYAPTFTVTPDSGKLLSSVTVSGAIVKINSNAYSSSSKLIQFNIGTNYTKLHSFSMICNTIGVANEGLDYLFVYNDIAYALTYGYDSNYNKVKSWEECYNSESLPVTLSNGVVTVYLSGYDSLLGGYYMAEMYVS